MCIKGLKILKILGERELFYREKGNAPFTWWEDTFLYGTNNHKANTHSRVSPDQKEQEEALKIEKFMSSQRHCV